MIFLLIFSSFSFANSFQLEGSANDFKLVIDARKVSYTSAKKGVYVGLRDCNIPLARALNAELLALVPKEEPKAGWRFHVDGNSYTIGNKESLQLKKMDEKMERFKASGDKACE